MYQMGTFESWSFVILLLVTVVGWGYWVELTYSQRREKVRDRLAWQQLAREEYDLQTRVNINKSLPTPDLYDQEKEEQREQYVGALMLTGYSREVANEEFERLWVTLTSNK